MKGGHGVHVGAYIEMEGRAVQGETGGAFAEHGKAPVRADIVAKGGIGLERPGEGPAGGVLAGAPACTAPARALAPAGEVACSSAGATRREKTDSDVACTGEVPVGRLLARKEDQQALDDRGVLVD